MASRRRERRNERAKLDATPPWQTRRHAEPDPTSGPFDVRDAPDDDLDRVDLGALRVHAMPGMDVRLEVNEAQQVVGVTLVSETGQLQLGVFAAPRNEGIWDDVRAEIRDSLNSQGGKAQDVEGGPFGTELRGMLAADGGRVPVRFVGVDGPRWFLRAMLVGPAAAEPALAKPFETAIRNVVVVRGNDPLPVRDPVPLQLPKEIAEQAEAAAAQMASDSGTPQGNQS